MAAIDFTDRNTFRAFEAGSRPGRRNRGARTAVFAGACLAALSAVFVPVALSGSAGRVGSPRARTNAETGYRHVLEKIERERDRLAGELAAAGGGVQRRAVLAQAAAAWSAAVVGDVIPFWYGTGYDYNGATAVPGVGGISCGHFVTTVLRDSGVRLDRIALAQLPSETLIRALVAETSIRRYSNLSGEAFLEACRKMPRGLYALGLDKHVGFLVLDASGASFIHSTLLPPYSVVREPAASSRALMRSAYRVLGDLSGDAGLIRAWLERETVAVPRAERRGS